MTKIAQALTIAGSDSGGGAGIQADLKTFQMQKVFGMSVITAVTAQNTLGVTDIHLVPTQSIQAQLQAIVADFSPNAVKIGMLGTAEIITTVATFLKQHSLPNVVIDPVMIAKGGASLLEQSAIQAMREQLLPLAHVLTPNLPEAEALTGLKAEDSASLQRIAETLQKMGAKTVIIKGGHQQNSQSAVCKDVIFTPTYAFELESPRFNTPHTHGTGCTFSACLTAELAKGLSLEQACKTAKAFITSAITHPLHIGQGHGPTNHWAYSQEQQNG
ncbi:bifunctional hydroxymethylpyrimidine kinase/phosphomethylpyrimidine kinase [Avibacterium paragallinarum]|uniref:bifunctional hydroxymethylpyrimidine kinase/phosphomethylpyrimidine kinase n=1 Tax=Avibacterium paragallinarum TaxID=728 RepID=UPI003978BA49